MKFDALIADIAKVAEVVAAEAVPGAAPFVKVAESVVALITTAKQTLGKSAAELDASRDALEASIKAHAQRTMDSLG